MTKPIKKIDLKDITISGLTDKGDHMVNFHGPSVDGLRVYLGLEVSSDEQSEVDALIDLAIPAVKAWHDVYRAYVALKHAPTSAYTTENLRKFFDQAEAIEKNYIQQQPQKHE